MRATPWSGLTAIDFVRSSTVAGLATALETSWLVGARGPRWVITRPVFRVCWTAFVDVLTNVVNELVPNLEFRHSQIMILCGTLTV